MPSLNINTDGASAAIMELRNAGYNSLVVGGAVRDALLGIEPKDIDIEVYGIDYPTLESILKKHGVINVVGKSFGVIKFKPFKKTNKESENEAIQKWIKSEYPDDYISFDWDGVILEIFQDRNKAPLEFDKEELIEKGVDFPKEEILEYDFSVPRRESRIGVGHTDFSVSFDKDMTPKEAAERRDFTFNALAYDPVEKKLHDYYGGADDLKSGIIKATSDKFSEDALRILRAMQFQSRFGFSIDPTTLETMREMVAKGEMNNLPKERVSEEWMKWALKGKHPNLIFGFIHGTGLDFPHIGHLCGVKQDAEWHPEGDVEVHTGFVLQAAVDIADREGLEGDERAVLILASLCHDFAKPDTTQLLVVKKVVDGKTIEREAITSRGHEKEGGAYAKRFLDSIGIKSDITDKVVKLVENHLEHVNIAASEPKGRLSATRKLAKRLSPANIKELLYLVEADSSGRPPLPKGLPASGKLLEEAAKEAGVEEKKQEPIIKGRHLMELGLKAPKSTKEIEVFRGILNAALQAEEQGIYSDVENGKKWVIVEYKDLFSTKMSDGGEVYYHGTDDEFEVFDIDKAKKWRKFGLWFTAGKDYADNFGTKIKTVRLKIKNPKTISGETWNAIREKHAKDDEWFTNWRNQLIADGYDALKVKEYKEMFAGQQMVVPEIIAVFNNSQVENFANGGIIYNERVKGDDVETGNPITLNILKNTEKAPNFGSRYGQDVEPAGNYVTQDEIGFTPTEGWKSGKVSFKNPLVIDVTDDTMVEWKRDLSKKYGNKKRKALTEALKKEGYDGIITRRNGELGEIIAFDNSVQSIRYADGGEVDKKETYEKWKGLVNMSKGELEKFYNSEEGKAAGISTKTAKEEGISRGRTSAKWIMKMKGTPVKEWTPEMWKWANKQISFISRMRGNKGDLYDDKGKKTRKHTSLLIWGHNPEKFADGGEVGEKAKSLIQVNKAIHEKYPLVNLVKGDGYFYISSDDEEIGLKLSSLFTTSIYCYSIKDMTVKRWVEDVDNLMNPVKKSICEKCEKEFIGIDDYLCPECEQTYIMSIMKPTKTIGELSELHDVPEIDLEIELERGIVVELEHTTDEKIAETIALHHLEEMPDYYTRLKKMEKAGNGYRVHIGNPDLYNNTDKVDKDGYVHFDNEKEANNFADEIQSKTGEFLNVEKEPLTADVSSFGDPVEWQKGEREERIIGEIFNEAKEMYPETLKNLEDAVVVEKEEIFNLWKQYAKKYPDMSGNPNYVYYIKELEQTPEIADKLYAFNHKYIELPLTKYNMATIDELNELANTESEALSKRNPETATMDTAAMNFKGKTQDFAMVTNKQSEQYDKPYSLWMLRYSDRTGSGWHFDNVQDAVDYAQNKGVLTDTAYRYEIRDRTTGKLLMGKAEIKKILKGEKLLSDYKFEDGGAVEEMQEYEIGTYLEKVKMDAESLLLSNQSKIGKAIICKAHIELAEYRINLTESGLEKNAWQEVKNIWQSCFTDIKNDFCIDTFTDKLSDGGKAEHDCGCGKNLMSKGGLAYGNSHDKGGIPLTVKSTGQNVEIEGAEGIVNKRAMQSDKKVELNGRKMTPCEAVSNINQIGGGVKFKCEDVKEIIKKDGSF